MNANELIRLFAAAFLALCFAQPVFANEQAVQAAHPAKAATTADGHNPEAPAAKDSVLAKHSGGEAKDLFCESLVEEAREQRYYLIEKRLTLLMVEAEKRMIDVRAKKAELETWVLRREAFAEQASGNLVEIYAGMKPEASAARLEKLDSGLAASLLLAIAPRQAGVILNEMDEKVAADITAIMAASARRKDPS